MKHRINARAAGCLLALGLTGLTPIAAQAQAQPVSNGWGGVGAGFHGVGAGGRGVGVR